MKAFLTSLALVGILSAQSGAQSILFDFDDAQPFHSLPLDLTHGGIAAHFVGTGQSFSVQELGINTFGIVPAGFGGNCLLPNSIYASDLIVSFSALLVDFSIMYAPEEYDCDSSARMRVTAYMDGSLVGTNTTTTYAGTWPTGTLQFASSHPFNSVVVHYDAPPPTGGDWGPIFMADNMRVTPTPEPATMAALALGIGALVRRRRR